MYFDSHAHYDDKRFSSDRFDLLSAMPEAGISLILNAACDIESSYVSAELAGKFGFVYASAGIHPHEAKSYSPAAAYEIETLCKDPKTVAVGEIGLDYHYDFSPREKQREVFYTQLELARALNLPVIVHDRDAHADCMKAVRDFPGLTGVFHCFSGSLETAKELINLGWYISFTGSITFKNAKKALEIIAALPEDRFFLETDAPYLAPVPKRGERNDSRNLPYIADFIASVRGTTSEHIAALTTENGKRFFGIN